MQSARCVLSAKFCHQGFKTVHQIWWKLGKPIECPFLQRSGENLFPHCLVCCVEIHLHLVNVQVLVWICGTIIEFDAQSLPFGRGLCLHDIVDESMFF